MAGVSSLFVAGQHLNVQMFPSWEDSTNDCGQDMFIFKDCCSLLPCFINPCTSEFHLPLAVQRMNPTQGFWLRNGDTIATQ